VLYYVERPSPLLGRPALFPALIKGPEVGGEFINQQSYSGASTARSGPHATIEVPVESRNIGAIDYSRAGGQTVTIPAVTARSPETINAI
jgi:hypothetical protein